MKILIIDNEAPIRTMLAAMLQHIVDVNDEIFEANGVVTGLQNIETIGPDIVFLDIEMDDGTGFDLLQQLHKINFQLIITTAHNKYAIDAFKVSAIDYLLKPISQTDLIKSIEKAKLYISHSHVEQQLQVLMSQINKTNGFNKKIVLKDIDSTYFIAVNDILYCEAGGTYTKFFFSNSNPILVSKNLKEYESILEPLGFIRTHHSYLVNPNKIKMISKKEQGCLVLEGGSLVPISQRKKEFVFKKLES
ncbi:MAG: LytR/AlgR family response regulator transcription factor [Chitinophagaceae bacterium]|jgi:two-component system LytT family response regulator